LKSNSYPVIIKFYPDKKAIAQSKVVTKTIGLVLDELSSKSDTILSLNKRIGESVQNAFEKINIPNQNKLSFSSAGGGCSSGIEATFDYVDENVMRNFNKVTSSDTLQSTVKNIDNNISSIGSSSIKGGLDDGLGTYASQAGHHPMAKSAFEAISQYDFKQALTISQSKGEARYYNGTTESIIFCFCKNRGSAYVKCHEGN